MAVNEPNLREKSEDKVCLSLAIHVSYNCKVYCKGRQIPCQISLAATLITQSLTSPSIVFNILHIYLPNRYVKAVTVVISIVMLTVYLTPL